MVVVVVKVAEVEALRWGRSSCSEAEAARIEVSRKARVRAARSKQEMERGGRRRGGRGRVLGGGGFDSCHIICGEFERI